MANWERKHLGAIATFRTGKLDSNAAEENGIYPFFTCSPETFAINTYAFDTEAVLLAGNNASAIYPVKYYKGKFNAYQRTYVIEPKSSELADCRYLYYLILYLLQKLKDASVGSATKFLTKRILENFEIEVPPLEEQKAIAEFLSSLDDKINVNLRMNATLEATTRTLFKAWFLDFEPVHANLEHRPSTSASHEIVELFPSGFENGVPKGWLDTKFASVIQEETKRNRNSRKLPVLSAIQTGELVKSADFFNKQVFSAETAKYKVVEPLNYAFNPSRINIGSIGLNALRQDGLVSPVYVVFSVRPGFAEWLRFHIRSEKVRNYINILASGTVRQNLTFKDFASIPLTLPSLETVKAFEDICRPIRDQIEVNTREMTTLSEIRDSLLPHLISGKIRVSEARAEEEPDDPA